MSLLPRTYRLILLTGVAVCANACDFAAPTHAPALPVPAGFKESSGAAAGNWQQAAPADESPRGEWWKAFRDHELDALEDHFTQSNQDIRIMLARFEEARAQASSAYANFFPVVTGTSNATRNGASSTVANARPVTSYNDYLLEGEVSYEIDVWGRVRNAVAAAKDQATASKADLAAVELSLRAELAGDYFALRADDAAQEVLDETVKDYKRAFDVTSARFQGGVIAETDVDQAETQYQTTQTQAADMRLKRAQLEHAIAILTGASASSFALTVKPIDAQPLTAEPGLPSTLIERRPDIAAAERRVAAANAEIGVARASWFPVFSLTGALGYETAAGASFFSTANRFWSAGPSAALGFLDFGHLTAVNEEARAVYDEEAASYRKVVLAAYQEVEDDLASLHHLHDESVSQKAATKAAYRALAREQDRYSGGLVTYLDVVVTQNTALQSKLSSIDILARQMTASVQLVKALGGGWQGRTPVAWDASLKASALNPDNIRPNGPEPLPPAPAITPVAPVPPVPPSERNNAPAAASAHDNAASTPKATANGLTYRK